MNECKHQNLVLLPPPKDRIRCRHCHLTLRTDELTNRYCPECYEARGIKRFDFDEVAEARSETIQYSCEECGVLIVVPAQGSDPSESGRQTSESS